MPTRIYEVMFCPSSIVRKGKRKEAAAKPNAPPRTVSHARANSTVIECSPDTASVTTKTKAPHDVREHLAEAITLGDMANAAGMSPMHFAALFREATGLRPHHYLLEQRVLHAKELMTRTSWRLCDIAASTGFSTQAPFTTVFKRIAGTTPRQWRFSRMS